MASEEHSRNRDTPAPTHAPLVSVVTVTFNAATTLRRTLDSTLAQTLPGVELIVVDGGSTDGTLEILKSYGTRITRWVSEPDAGIYDAMNKGVALASGQFVQFLNAGDTHFAADSLERLIRAAGDADIVYGDTMFDYDGEYQRLKRALPVSWLWATTACLHPSSIARRAVLSVRPFELRYRLAADYDFFVRCWVEGVRFRQIEGPVAVFDRGGVSNARWFEALDEARRISQERCPRLYTQGYYAGLIAYYHVAARAKTVLPPAVIRIVRKAGSLGKSVWSRNGWS